MAIPRGDAVEKCDTPFPSPSRFVASTLLSSAAVTHAVRGRFRRPEVVDVVLGKRDALVLLVPSGDEKNGRLRLERTQSSRGTVIDLKVVTGKTTTTPEKPPLNTEHDTIDYLLALSCSGTLSLMTYDVNVRRFVCLKSVPLGHPGLKRIARDAATPTPVSLFHTIAVAPNSQWVVTFCESRVCLFPGAEMTAVDQLNSETRECPEPANPGKKEKKPRGIEPLPLPVGREVTGASFADGTFSGTRKTALALLVRESLTESTTDDKPVQDETEDTDTVVDNDPDQMETDRRFREFEAVAALAVAAEVAEYENENETRRDGRDGPQHEHAAARAGRHAGRVVDARMERRNRRNNPDRNTSGGASITDPPAFPALTRSTEKNVAAPPSRVDIFLEKDGDLFSKTQSDAYAPTHSVMFDARTKAVLGARACFAEGRDEAASTRETSRDAEVTRVRFLIIGEFGAVEVCLPLFGDAHVRVVSEANTGERWVPTCHAWQSPVKSACDTRNHRWTLAVAVETDEIGDDFPDLRAVVAIVRETGDAVNISREPSTKAHFPTEKAHSSLNAMVALPNGRACVIFGANGDAAVRSMPFDSSSAIDTRHRQVVFATDAVDLVTTDPETAVTGEAPNTAPALANVDGFARFAGGDTSHGGFLVTANGSATRVTRGIAARCTPVSPAGFGDVVQMWAPDETTLVLCFASATRVFHVTRGENTRTRDTNNTSSSFQESGNNLGFEGEECTTGCGVFWVGPNTHQKPLMQITPRRARVCVDGAVVAEWRPHETDGGIGCAAIAPHGRAAVSLPLRQCVMLLAPMAVAQKRTTHLLPVSIVKLTVEPSCLTLPDRRTATEFIANAKEDAITASDVKSGSVTVLVCGTYARDVIAVAARETIGCVATRASEVFRLECALGVNDAPCALRVVSSSFGDNKKPTLLVTTRGGDLLVVEPSGSRGASRKRNGMALGDTRSLSLPPKTFGERVSLPKQRPRLTGFGGNRIGASCPVGQTVVSDPAVIRIGVDTPALAASVSAQTRLSKMFEPPVVHSPIATGVGVNRGGEKIGADEERAKTETESNSGFRVVLRVSLGDAPLAMDPLGLDLASPVLLTSAAGTWLARLVDGAQRVSVERVGAPLMKSLCSLHLQSEPCFQSRRASLFATIGDRLHVVDVDVAQHERAHRSISRTFGGSRYGNSKVRFVTNLPHENGGTGIAAVAAAAATHGGDLNVATWRSPDDDEGDESDSGGNENDAVDVGLGDDQTDDTETCAYPLSDSSGFSAVAFASCLAEDGSLLLAIGTRGVAGERLRRVFDGTGETSRVEGRVLFLRALSGDTMNGEMDDDGGGDGVGKVRVGPFPNPKTVYPHKADTFFYLSQRGAHQAGGTIRVVDPKTGATLTRFTEPKKFGSGRKTKSGENRFALAATVAFPDAVTCVSPGPTGLILVGTNAGAHVLRVETRVGERDDGWSGDGLSSGDVKTVSGTLRVWLAARLATRRPVLAIAAGDAEYPTGFGPGDVPELVVTDTNRPEPSSERAMVEAMLFPGARAVETRKVVP